MLMPAFKQVPAGSSYSRISWARFTITGDVSTSEGVKKKTRKQNKIRNWRCVCLVALYFRGLKKNKTKNNNSSEIRSFSWQMMQHFAKIILLKFQISHFENIRSYSCSKSISPSEGSSVSWLIECGWGRQRQADTLAFPYGTFCKAIGVRLHDADCHWLVMKASRAEAYPSHWGVEVGVRGWPGGLEGVSVGKSALLPVTHHAAWPATSSGLCTMGGLGPDCMSSHSLLPPPTSQQVGEWGGKGGVEGQNEPKHHWTDISLTLSLEDLNASDSQAVNICSVSH